MQKFLFRDRPSGRPLSATETVLRITALLILVNLACAAPGSTTPSGFDAVITESTVAFTQTATPQPTATLYPTETLASTHTLTPTETDTPTITPTPFVINPLTGLIVQDPSVILRRPIGIKVSNYPRTARPQAGLSFADVLFEFYQEHGETRWHAIFLGRDVEKVGPIRSARKVDARLQRIFQSIFVYNAADQRVLDWFVFEDVKRFAISEGPAPCPAICRDTSQAQINSVYGNTTAIRKVAGELGIPDIVPDLSGWVFSGEKPASEDPASILQVRFLTDQAIAEWRYNPEDQKYYRWSETTQGLMAELTDRLTKEQLSVSNLVVLFVNYLRKTGTEIYEVELYGNGMALFFRDGYMETGSWRMPKYDRLPLFFGDHGEGPYPLRPGATWVVLVENSSSFTSEDGLIRVEFGQPRG